MDPNSSKMSGTGNDKSEEEFSSNQMGSTRLRTVSRVSSRRAALSLTTGNDDNARTEMTALEQIAEELEDLGSTRFSQKPTSRMNLTTRRLLVLTLAHILLNFTLSGSTGIPGAVLPTMVAQAVGYDASESQKNSVNLLFSLVWAIANVVAVILVGWLVDHYQSHYVFFGIAVLGTANLILLPYAQGIALVMITNGILFFTMGAMDCSFGTLTWSLAEEGIAPSRAAPFLVLKSFGTNLGSLVAVLTVMLTTDSDGDDKIDYRAMALTWAGLCAVAGVLIVLIPSPLPPTAAFAARETGGRAENVAWRELLFVGYGALVLFLLMGIMTGAVQYAVLFTGDVYIAQLIEVAFYASWALGMVFSLVLSEVRKWPAGPILVLNIGLSGVGSFIVAVALFVSAPSLPSPGSTLIVLFIGYSLIGFSLMSCFSVTFGVIGDFVKLSGQRSGFLALGAALGPLMGTLPAIATSLGIPYLVFIIYGLALWSVGGLITWMLLKGKEFLRAEKKRT